MKTRRKRKPRSLASQAAQLAVSVPQVVTLRLARMAIAGQNPSPADLREIHRMGAEKVAAFYESWFAMATEALRVNQTLTLSLARSLWFPWASSARPSPVRMQRLGLDILSRGVAPVRRRAVANAKRLSRAKRR